MSVASEEERIKVLFIDDERDILELADKHFEKEEKIELKTLTSAMEGLELIEEEGGFDAVVADYKMPGMDGIDLLRNLREKGYDIPYIILTGKGKEEVAMEALNKGADRYYMKKRDSKSQFRELTRSIVEEVIRKKSETELKTFQTWIKNTLSRDWDH